MSAGLYNFTIEQGTTVDFKIQYKDVSGSAINLTGYGAAMQIRSNYADNNPITYITLSSSLASDGTGLNMNSASLGFIGIFISACSSSDLNFPNARYDLEVFTGSVGSCPITTRILEGQVYLSKETTRPV
jgi:hypothetical protein